MESRFHEARLAFLDWTRKKSDWSRANTQSRDWAWRAWQSLWAIHENENRYLRELVYKGINTLDIKSWKKEAGAFLNAGKLPEEVSHGDRL